MKTLLRRLTRRKKSPKESKESAGKNGKQDEPISTSIRSERTVPMYSNSDQASMTSCSMVSMVSHDEEDDIGQPDVSRYGYEDATPDAESQRDEYGYGDDQPSSPTQYGYEDAQTDISGCGYGESEPDSSQYAYGESEPDASQYGYGDAQPDVSKYGYGDARPDVSKYGYGDAQPDSQDKDLGYEDAKPDSDQRFSPSCVEQCPVLPRHNRRRRASIQIGAKPAASPSPPAPKNRRSRRASIQFGAAPPKPVESPTSTRSRVPRRSSMKTAGSTALRRASINNGSGEAIEVNLPCQKSVTRRRSITFNNSDVVKSITPSTDLVENPEELWFQKDEYKKIRAKRYEIVQKVESGVEPDAGRKLCVRGLETMFSRSDCLERTHDAWDSVLETQDLQRDKGYYDDETMASMYSHTTHKSKLEAYHRAKQDAESIENYLRQTRRACRRMSM